LRERQEPQQTKDSWTPFNDTGSWPRPAALTASSLGWTELGDRNPGRAAVV